MSPRPVPRHIRWRRAARLRQLTQHCKHHGLKVEIRHVRFSCPSSPLVLRQAFDSIIPPPGLSVPLSEFLHGLKLPSLSRGYTVAVISKAGCPAFSGLGVAICSSKDVWCGATGAFVALSRAFGEERCETSLDMPEPEFVPAAVLDFYRATIEEEAARESPATYSQACRVVQDLARVLGLRVSY